MKTGHEAIESKKINSAVRINKFADPIESERLDISISEALEIADEDPTLLWTSDDFGRTLGEMLEAGNSDEPEEQFGLTLGEIAAS